MCRHEADPLGSRRQGGSAQRLVGYAWLSPPGGNVRCVPLEAGDVKAQVEGPGPTTPAVAP